MKVAITGATGLVGSHLAAHLVTQGHEVRAFARGPGGAWDPERGRVERSSLENVDAVVHLAGENLFGRWTAAKKRRIYDSRVAGTHVISEALAGLARRPRVLLTASAVGYYGSRGAEELTEQSAAADDFLARVVIDWEAATAPAARAGVRVVNMRFGVVLARGGGALRTMLPAFRLGLGGPIGDGRQYFSWIALDDLIDAITFLLGADGLSGPVNVTAPAPVTNREFVQTLGRVLRRPAVIPVPPFALQLAFGAEAAGFMMGGQRVLPARLAAAGFQFRFGAIEPALRHLLGKAG